MAPRQTTTSGDRQQAGPSGSSQSYRLADLRPGSRISCLRPLFASGRLRNVPGSKALQPECRPARPSLLRCGKSPIESRKKF